MTRFKAYVPHSVRFAHSNRQNKPNPKGGRARGRLPLRPISFTKLPEWCVLTTFAQSSPARTRTASLLVVPKSPLMNPCLIFEMDGTRWLILIYAKDDGPAWILIKEVLILILSRYWFDPIILIGKFPFNLNSSPHKWA